MKSTQGRWPQRITTVMGRVISPSSEESVTLPRWVPEEIPLRWIETVSGSPSPTGKIPPIASTSIQGSSVVAAQPRGWRPRLETWIVLVSSVGPKSSRSGRTASDPLTRRLGLAVAADVVPVAVATEVAVGGRGVAVAAGKSAAAGTGVSVGVGGAAVAVAVGGTGELVAVAGGAVGDEATGVGEDGIGDGD